jgi:hypothetical protein
MYFLSCFWWFIQSYFFYKLRLANSRLCTTIMIFGFSLLFKGGANVSFCCRPISLDSKIFEYIWSESASVTYFFLMWFFTILNILVLVRLFDIIFVIPANIFMINIVCVKNLSDIIFNWLARSFAGPRFNRFL